jgi:hypothetical protein
MSSFDPRTGSIVLTDDDARKYIPANFSSQIPIITAEQAGYPARKLREGDWNNFASRLLFAFRPFGGTHTVIRGGYGVFFDNQSVGASENLLLNGPFTLREDFRNQITAGKPRLTLTNPFLASGTVASTNISFDTPSLDQPYSQQWNLTFEQNLGFDRQRLPALARETAGPVSLGIGA